MRASDLFTDDYERQEVKSWLDLVNGKVTLVIQNRVILYENKSYKVEKSIDKKNKVVYNHK